MGSKNQATGPRPLTNEDRLVFPTTVLDDGVPAVRIEIVPYDHALRRIRLWVEGRREMSIEIRAAYRWLKAVNGDGMEAECICCRKPFRPLPVTPAFLTYCKASDNKGLSGAVCEACGALHTRAQLEEIIVKAMATLIELVPRG